MIADSSRPPAARDGASQAPSLVARLQGIVGDVLRMPPPEPDVELLEVGANSVDIMRLANRLEDEFGFRPAVDELYELPTISAIASYYQARFDTGAALGPLTHPAPQDKRTAHQDVLLDFFDRVEFKKGEPGLRCDLDTRPEVPLHTTPGDDEALRQGCRERRSYRRFRAEALPAAGLGRLLGCLRRAPNGDGYKYWYGSAGGLYPVQVYVHVKSGRVADLEGGAYYYDPAHHALRRLEATDIDRGVHAFVNRRAFEAAAFSLFLIGQLDAIEPMYGQMSRDFCLLEAGAMGQLLTMHAPGCGIGLCGIGSLRFDDLRAAFMMTDRHILLHSFVGGALPPDAGGESMAARPALDLARVDEVLKKLEETSIEQMRTMLAARRSQT
ncbi:MAG: phosphopantetheine-binding protein [Vicinamibacterales bacterium]